MCGRYASSASRDKLIETFAIDVVGSRGDPAPPEAEWLQPRWNLAPTDPVPGVLERLDPDAGVPVRRLTGLRWGLVPSWSHDASGAARMINARLETVTEKPSFRKAMASRRCLLPADGYYEWYASSAQPTPPTCKVVKQPFFIHPADATATGGLMVMAGLYEFWKDPQALAGVDPWLVSCTIITTAATDDLGMIHDRMPVQVRPEHWADWLDPSLTDSLQARSLLHIPGVGEMNAYAVSRLVSNVRNDGPELIAELPAGQ